MSILANNAERILDFIKASGGSATGAQLREEISDLSPTHRRQAMKLLQDRGDVSFSGATTKIVYHLEGSPLRQQGDTCNPALEVRVRSHADVVDQDAHHAQLLSDQAATIATSLADGRTDPLRLSVPLLETDEEIQLLGVLDFVLKHYTQRVSAHALDRAIHWISAKHQVQR